MKRESRHSLNSQTVTISCIQWKKKKVLSIWIREKYKPQPKEKSVSREWEIIEWVDENFKDTFINIHKD